MPGMDYFETFSKHLNDSCNIEKNLKKLEDVQFVHMHKHVKCKYDIGRHNIIDATPPHHFELSRFNVFDLAPDFLRWLRITVTVDLHSF